MNKVIDRYIVRSNIDEDQFHLVYRYDISAWYRGLLNRLTCTIHIDDIEGLFGTDFYERVKLLKQDEWLEIDLAISFND